MKLLLNGYLTTDLDDNASLSEDNNEYHLDPSIAETIQDAFDSGYSRYIDEGLGRTFTIIPSCSISIYYTEEACTFEEAQTALLLKLDGDMNILTSLTGWSEYTIDGLDIDEFKIGGHDLEQELESHLGEYCWISIVF